MYIYRTLHKETMELNLAAAMAVACLLRHPRGKQSVCYLRLIMGKFPNSFPQYSAVAVYATDACLKTSHNSRLVLP
jgi:hypothetical protein